MPTTSGLFNDTGIYRFACASCHTVNDPRTDTGAAPNNGTYRFCTACATPEAIATREDQRRAELVERRTAIIHELAYIESVLRPDWTDENL